MGILLIDPGNNASFVLSGASTPLGETDLPAAVKAEDVLGLGINRPRTTVGRWPHSSMRRASSDSSTLMQQSPKWTQRAPVPGAQQSPLAPGEGQGVRAVCNPRGEKWPHRRDDPSPRLFRRERGQCPPYPAGGDTQRCVLLYAALVRRHDIALSRSSPRHGVRGGGGQGPLAAQFTLEAVAAVPPDKFGVPRAGHLAAARRRVVALCGDLYRRQPHCRQRQVEGSIRRARPETEPIVIIKATFRATFRSP